MSAPTVFVSQSSFPSPPKLYASKGLKVMSMLQLVLSITLFVFIILSHIIDKQSQTKHEEIQPETGTILFKNKYFPISPNVEHTRTARVIGYCCSLLGMVVASIGAAVTLGEYYTDHYAFVAYFVLNILESVFLGVFVFILGLWSLAADETLEKKTVQSTAMIETAFALVIVIIGLAVSDMVSMIVSMGLICYNWEKTDFPKQAQSASSNVVVATPSHILPVVPVHVIHPQPAIPAVVVTR